MKSLLLRALGRARPVAAHEEEEPIRSELFSVERLEQHAESLASNQPVHRKPTSGRSLVARLRENDNVLLEAYRSIAKAADEGRPISPAAEWLLDNYHLVEEQVREVRTDLPPGYYRELPKLSDGPLAGYPRVFGLAWAFVAHTDSRFDPETLTRFVRAYQTVQPLGIGELWAVAITLRLVLVENLRRSARRIMIRRSAREEADAVADRLLGVNETAPDPAALVPYEGTSLAEGFVVQLVQRLRDQDPEATPAVRWLEERLAREGLTAEELVRREHQLQGATNVSVRNIITSMRLVSDVDWAKFFETVSPVDDVLRAGSAFADMDFATRNLYRTAIEQMARGTRLSEPEIARRALAAAAAADQEGDPRQHDPGYHLIGRGRAAFERSLAFRPPGLALRRRFATAGIAGYVGSVALTAGVILFLPLWALADMGVLGWQLAAMTMIGLPPAVDAALMVVNRVITGGFGATLLPSLALRDGVPPELRTLVAIPTLLPSIAGVEELIERLEVHYLSNPGGAVHFALLSDWSDASTESTPEDSVLLAAADAGIARLNSRYPSALGGDRFLLLHRRRLWNAAEGRWMGWERKRGKLHELNRLLRGSTDTTFLTLDDRKLPADVRFVVTLDTDTRLPRDAVCRLVGKMAHPLNRPRFDSAEGRVVEGYGVLQPRVTASLPVSTEGSLFQRIFSSNSGIDPYSSAVSDVYQDLFGEGSYSGKGIYDIDAFEAALDGRVPDNSMLSHDLFEGVFARSGLASDIEVIEEFPARYDVAAARHHRWTRGDWQLLPWMLGRRRGPRGDHVPAIGFWKMFDNLRRTLSPPAAVVALLAGWTLPLPGALAWTVFVVLVLGLPTMLPVAAALLPRRSGVTARSHLGALATDLGLALSQMALIIAFLAHQAWQMLDAIGRTLFRLFVSRRRLLEWTTAAQTQQLLRTDRWGFVGQMAGSLAVACGAAVFVFYAGRAALPVAAPILLAWFLSPAIARWVSLAQADAGRLAISSADARSLRLIARRTWRFFETFVTEAEHMLPPDNFQEDPKPVVARRTSPTNIGLYLLSTVAARDFGWIGTIEAVQRIEATLATMERLKRYRGHFFNWYDTSDLRALEPAYVSTVDSGNLAGHLIALANACAVWRTESSPPAAATGVSDNLALARQALAALPDDRRTHLVSHQELTAAVESLTEAMSRVEKPDGTLNKMTAALATQAGTVADLARTLASERGDEASADMLFWVEAAQRSIDSCRGDSVQTAEARAALERRVQTIANTVRAMANAMEFDFLLNQDRRLLSIGYLATEDRLDPSCYDLLASEARLASFVAIANGTVPARHWFRLGRAVTPVGRGAALISWSGSMFEYLMPSLVMRAPLGSLIERTNDLIVRRQIDYATSLGLPWGVSESAYNARDKEFTYQYSNFGVPGLGFKRGLSENAVMAPYATALATMVDPRAATANFARLAAIGGEGRFGFYEAIDFTPARLPEGKTQWVVRAYMAHHQGMTVVAIANALLDGIMRTRFHAEPMIQATELLLQERTPRDVAIAHPRAEEVGTSSSVEDLEPAIVRRLHNPHAASPSVHMLSNGRYSVMLTASGSGYSRWGEVAVTRWREDTTRDDWGSYIFLRDIESAAVWSATYQPRGTRPDSYNVMFAEDRAEIMRRDGTLTTTLDIVVSPEDDAEVRRVSITNTGAQARDIEVTSYAEIVLASPAADAAHQAFSKIFVQTEYLSAARAILATRRRRSPGEPELWAAHLAVVEGESVGEVEIETDRARFLGRGNDVGAPVAVCDGRRLSNTAGPVLDPVFALRRRVWIPAGSTVKIAFWTMVASSREALLDAIDKHQDTNAFERAATLAWTQAQVQLRHLDIAPAQATLYQRLAGHVLYANPALRSSSDTIRRGLAPPPVLWAQGISGDLPIVLVRIDEVEDSGIVRELLRAREYWRLKGLAVDLVILNERGASYVQDLQVTLETLVRTHRSRTHFGADGDKGIFVLRSDLISAETRALLLAVARVVLPGRRGSLADQLNRLQTPPGVVPPLRRRPLTDAVETAPPPPVAALGALQYFNGLGGFSPDGREYVTVLGPGQSTPAPWINVVSNPSFGFQVATDGGGYTWSENSRDNQLTPWSNDPVSDRPGEVFYVRDLDSGDLWGPTALPIRHETAPYIVRHGRGYSRFEVVANGIALGLLQFVPLRDSIKISRLTIRNMSDRPRRLSVTAYVDWVLGLGRGASAPTVVTERDPASGAIFARNPWNMHQGTRVAFADLGGRQTAWTADRSEFIGRNCTADNPAALSGTIPLSQRVGAGLDPCAALQTVIELDRGASTEIVFFLGQTEDAAAARALIERYRAADLDAVHREVVSFWDETLGVLQVKTPDRSMDILLNGWLLYQTLACRYWARAAFYQAGGAYGFRDQLQDVMSLMVARPELARAHVLRAAARQFVEGDVQHWWFPPAGQGVRTRISDDRAWLATVAAHYVETTGDAEILDERVPFIDGPALRPGEHDLYFQPNQADETASLFEHCARGLDLSLATGAHGLPLMGTGDWNDGMNKVGEAGHGESVWLGWFVHAALTAFIPIAHARKDLARVERWTAHAEALREALDRDGWDGEWYRRGYYDDGTPLGSAGSDECRIDSIAQSWAALSGAARPDRAVQAMAALDGRLVNRSDRVAPLFTPPFDKTALEPGYIKGYPPGIRENGGQYTHAAAWSIMGFAALGQGDKAAELFSLINPINHTATRAGVLRYKVEPYVVAADVYSVAPHVGRGGWTWYSGSAGWLYRAGAEAILGLRLKGNQLWIDPCIPAAWPGYDMTLRYRGAVYEISVRNPGGVSRGVSALEIDGQPSPVMGGKACVPLREDRDTHAILVTLGP
ncbi:MAG: glucoamylase family protein [Reyranella sp.]|nr:glucoamylase family protein [Reyranella sp.]